MPLWMMQGLGCDDALLTVQMVQVLILELLVAADRYIQRTRKFPLPFQLSNK